MKNIVILISGGGSNMAAIVKTAQRDHWREKYGAQVAAVISNKAQAGGLDFARAQGIATEVLDHISFASREAFDAALAAVIDQYGTPTQPVVFDKAGTAVLGCNIHDKMVAYIHVVDTPYFARTDAKGTASIDVPAGEHRVRAWHPLLGPGGAPQESLIRAVAGSAATASFRLSAP